MYSVKVNFYGRGNAPRGLKGFGDRVAAEDHALYVLDRYENRQIAGPAHDKRIKTVDVQDEYGNSLTSWTYPEGYSGDYFLHGHFIESEEEDGDDA